MIFIPVLYSTDAEGLSLLKVSIFSLLFNQRKDTFIDLVIACKNFRESDIKEVSDVVRRFENCSIRFIPCNIYEQQYSLDNIFSKSVLNIH
jgi:hypothetical protein